MRHTKSQGDVTSNKLFSGIKPSSLKLKYNQRNYVEKAEGDIIYQTDEKPDFTYLVIDGEVKVKYAGTKASIGVVTKTKNDFFGEKEIIEGTNRKTSAVALSNCLLYKIKPKELNNLVTYHKEIKLNSAEANKLPEDTESLPGGTEQKDSPYQIEFERKTLRLENPPPKQDEEIQSEKPSETDTEQKEEFLQDYSSAEDDQTEQFTDQDIETDYPFSSHEISDDEDLEKDITPSDDQTDTAEIPEDQSFTLEEDDEDLSFTEVTGNELPDIIIDDKSDDDEHFNSDLSDDLTAIEDDDFLEWDVENIDIDEKAAENLSEPEPFRISSSDIEPETESEKQPESVFRRDLSPVYQEAVKVCSKLQSDEIRQECVRFINRHIDVERVVVFFADITHSELIAELDSTQDKKTLRVRIGTGPVGVAARNKSVVIINDVAQDNRYPDGTDKLTGFNVKNTMIYPVTDSAGKVTAVIHLFNSAKNSFGKEDEEIIGCLAPCLSTALNNAAEVETLLNKNTLDSLGKISNFLIPDIKSPALTIKHYVTLVKKHEISQEQLSLIEMLSDQANSISDFVQTTLDFTQGKPLVQPKVQSFEAVMDGILKLLSEYVESRNVMLFKKLSSDVDARIDRRTLYQALFQIAKNACDAMPNGGNLFVSSILLDNKIRLEIKDEGVGIPENIRREIFEPFFTYNKKNATGLGLAIAKKIIDEHFGTIDFISKPKEYTVFIVTLPVDV